jgi:hypothetical protein
MRDPLRRCYTTYQELPNLTPTSSGNSEGNDVAEKLPGGTQGNSSRTSIGGDRAVFSHAALSAAQQGQVEHELPIRQDYVEHAIWICEEVSGDDHRFRAAIQTMRKYLTGEVNIQQVAEADHDFYTAFARLHPDGQTPSLSGSEAGSALLRAIWICCHKELEDMGKLMPGIYDGGPTPNAVEVATFASRAAGLHAGGADNLPSDPELLEAAKQRGKAAAEAETEWQLTHLLEVVGLGKNDG